MNPRGYFAVGIYQPKREVNVGSLWRTASLYGAAFVFTIGARYRRQASDTPHTPLHTPLFHFDNIDTMHAHLPWSCELVGIEMSEDAEPLTAYQHPERAAYLLGAEDNGLPEKLLAQCHDTVSVPCPAPQSMNVAVAGSIVVYDRFISTARPQQAATSQVVLEPC